MPRMKLEPLVAKRLIRLLATDDSFRALFVDDAGTALASIGHRPEDPAELEAFLERCMQGVQLASRKEIASAESEIFSMLTAGTGYTVPMLEAGNHTRTLRVRPEAA